MKTISSRLATLVISLLISTLALAGSGDPTTLHRGNSAELLSLDPQQAEDVASGVKKTYTGKQLSQGLPVELKGGVEKRLLVTTK